MADKVLQVVLMVVATCITLAVWYLFAGVLSLAFRQAAGILFLLGVGGILAADALWMRRVFRPKTRTMVG